jgi:uncharacterized membrane protein
MIEALTKFADRQQTPSDPINGSAQENKRRSGAVWSMEGVLLVCIIAAGICLRFTHLDHKVYWYDEAFTSLEVSGYSPRDAATDILTGRVVSSGEIDKYQFPTAKSPKTATDTVKGLIAIEPQLTPAYFVALRWWSSLFPESIAAIRALSAIFSVCALWAAFLLCREIFPSLPRVAYVCVALMAISPFQLLYAQEARPYGMWCAAAILSSALLLRAMRRRTAAAWALYALCAALSLYTFLFSILVLGGHALFVAIENKFRVTATTRAFAVALSAAIVSFIPWPYRGQHSGAGNDHYSLGQYAIKWVRSIGILFADFNLRKETSQWILVPYSFLLLVLLTTCGYSIYFLCRRATATQATYVLILMGSVCLPLTILDVAQGSSVSLVTRYIFPSLIGLQVAVAYMLAMKTGASCAARSRRAWQCSLALFLALGLASSVTMVQAGEWWNKDPENYVQAASRIINSAKAPVLVVSDAWFVPMLSLEHKLRPDVVYQLTAEPHPLDIQNSYGTIFAVKPSLHLRAQLGKNFTFELIDRSSDLWRLTPARSAPEVRDSQSEQ